MLRLKARHLQHQASNLIRQFLERDVGLDETLPELPLRLARVILDAPFVTERNVPSAAEGLGMLYEKYRKYCKHLDVPSRLVDRVKDEAMWLEILTEAFSSQESMRTRTGERPITPSSKETITEGPAPGPGHDVDHALFFRGADDSEFVLLVGLTQYVWAHKGTKTWGNYFRMRVLVLRHRKGDPRTEDDARTEDEESSEDVEDGDEEDEDDHEPMDAPESDEYDMVGGGAHHYCAEAHHPDTLWAYADDRHDMSGWPGERAAWSIIRGVARPGHWVRQFPYFTAEQFVPDGIWSIGSVRSVFEGVHGGKFNLDIRSDELFLLAKNIISLGCHKYAKDFLEDMRRFLQPLSKLFADILYEARVSIAYCKWPESHDWVTFDDNAAERSLALTFRFPGALPDEGPELSVKLRCGDERGVLCASARYAYRGLEGPGGDGPYDYDPVGAARVYLGALGCSRVRNAMHLVAHCNAPHPKVSFEPTRPWHNKRPLVSGGGKPYGYDLGEPALLGQILEVLAASVYPDVEVVKSLRFSRLPSGVRTKFDAEHPGLRVRPLVCSLQNAWDQTLMRVSIQCQTTKRPDHELQTFGPFKTLVTITVEPGEVRPSVVANQHCAKDLLKKYLLANSLCGENALDLLKAFQEGGSASLRTYTMWYRYFYTCRSDELEGTVGDLIDMLCLLTAGKMGLAKRTHLQDVTTSCGDGVLRRDIKTGVVWIWNLEPDDDGRVISAGQVEINFGPVGGELMLQFRVTVRKPAESPASQPIPIDDDANAPIPIHDDDSASVNAPIPTHDDDSASVNAPIPTHDDDNASVSSSKTLCHTPTDDDSSTNADEAQAQKLNASKVS